MRILDVGPWIAYPPEQGPAARAFNLLKQLSLRHDVRQFGRGAARLRRGERRLEEIPVTPMFRVYRYRMPMGGTAVEWWATRPRLGRVRGTLARRLACPSRLRELLEWANVIMVEDPLELALCKKEQPTGRYVFVAHGVGELSSVSSAGYDLVAEALATSELVIATSAHDRGELVSRYDLPPPRVVEVPSAVDVESLVPVDRETRAKLRRELDLPGGPLVVYAGGATPASRMGLSWVRRLAERDDRLRFVVVGGVGEPERRRNLMLTGNVKDPTPYLQAADAAVCPVEHAHGPRYELLEALAAGLPCVVFAETLRRTELVPGEHVLVAEKSERDLLDTLARVIDDPGGEARGLAERGRAYVVARHDARAAAAILEAALLELLAKPRGARSTNGSGGAAH